MKSNKLIILKLFSVHIIVYYVFFATLSLLMWSVHKNAFFFDKDEAIKIILSPILGITGMYDGYIFFLIPHFILFIMINKFFHQKNLLTNFFISSLFIYLFIYLNFKFNIVHIHLFSTQFFEKYSNFNILLIIIPSLIASFFFNWIFYKKT